MDIYLYLISKDQTTLELEKRNEQKNVINTYKINDLPEGKPIMLRTDQDIILWHNLYTGFYFQKFLLIRLADNNWEFVEFEIKDALQDVSLMRYIDAPDNFRYLIIVGRNFVHKINTESIEVESFSSQSLEISEEEKISKIKVSRDGKRIVIDTSDKLHIYDQDFNKIRTEEIRYPYTFLDFIVDNDHLSLIGKSKVIIAKISDETIFSFDTNIEYYTDVKIEGDRNLISIRKMNNRDKVYSIDGKLSNPGKIDSWCDIRSNIYSEMQGFEYRYNEYKGEQFKKIDGRIKYIIKNLWISYRLFRSCGIAEDTAALILSSETNLEVFICKKLLRYLDSTKGIEISVQERYADVKEIIGREIVNIRRANN